MLGWYTYHAFDKQQAPVRVCSTSSGLHLIADLLTADDAYSPDPSFLWFPEISPAQSFELGLRTSGNLPFCRTDAGMQWINRGASMLRRRLLRFKPCNLVWSRTCSYNSLLHHIPLLEWSNAILRVYFLCRTGQWQKTSAIWHYYHSHFLYNCAHTRNPAIWSEASCSIICTSPWLKQHYLERKFSFQEFVPKILWNLLCSINFSCTRASGKCLDNVVPYICVQRVCTFNSYIPGHLCYVL